MRVECTRAFQWAREGIHVESVAVGEVVEGRAAEIALEAGWGREVSAKPAATAQAAIPAAPENKGSPHRRR